MGDNSRTISLNGDHKVISFPPTRGDIKSPNQVINILLTMTYCHVHNFNVNWVVNIIVLITLMLINLSTVELLITSPTINLSTPLDFIKYTTRGDLSYSKSFLLDTGGICRYMGGYPPSFVESRLPSWGVKGRYTPDNGQINVCIV